MELTRSPLILKLISLQLPNSDFAIFGSGPMVAYGLKKIISDLDIIARGEAWRRAVMLASPRRATSGRGRVVKLFDGEIEIFDDWTPQGWNIDRLIDRATMIEGIRFVRLEDVLNWKRQMNRPKDGGDIELIEQYLESREALCE
jgi:hypothetical protein